MWLMQAIQLLWFIVCFQRVYSQSDKVKLRISHISSFPIETNNNFNIEIEPEMGSKLSYNVFDTMVIQISHGNGTEIEKYVHDYGFKDIIDKEMKDTYVTIPTWRSITREDKPEIMSIVIRFTRQANNRILNLFLIQTKDKETRRNLLKNLSEAEKLYTSKIGLFVEPKLELEIRTLDGRLNELMQDQPGIAKCRASDGMPMVKPTWENLNEFKLDPGSGNPGGTYSPKLNERQVRILVTVADHLKELRCRAGKTVASMKIVVLHHTSQISLEPEIGQYLQNGSSLLCVAVDGHPASEISWHLVQGPRNAKKYFNIDGKKLEIKPETPYDSEWIFNCSASNRVPRSFHIFNRTVSFIVKSQPESYFGINLTFQIMVGVAVMGAIIIFCTVIVFIVCIARRSCAGQAASRNNRRNGGPVKSPAEKKTLEAEQVTLLPPGAPQNHLDMVTNGTGSGPLPPPPPEYQLIIPPDNEMKQNLQSDQQIGGNESYTEVTYAELNTSDLPMKENKMLKINSKDEQVIYSQIIGTIATPDCAQRGGYISPENV